MLNKQVAPLELDKKNTVFYKQFAPIGAILVPSGHTVCRKRESIKKQAPAERPVCTYHKYWMLRFIYVFLSDTTVK